MKHDPVAGLAAEVEPGPRPAPNGASGVRAGVARVERARAEDVRMEDARIGGARAEVLARIGRALGREAPALDASAAPESVRARLTGPAAHTLPMLGEELVDRAVRLMEEVLIDVVRLQTRAEVPEALRDWLEGHGVDGALTVAPALGDVDFPDDYPHAVRRGAADGLERTSLTPCVAAVAETGSVVFTSTADTPATLNFLPENHAVVLHEDQVVAHVDDVFGRLRDVTGRGEPMPRAVNFVTGPSRTADVEQTLEIGAHGPKRMLVLLLPGDVPGATGDGADAP